MLKQANLSFSVAAQSYGDDVTSIQFSTQDKNTAKLIFVIKEGKLPLNLTDVEAKVDLVMGDKSVFDDNIATVTAPLDGKLEYTITPEQIRHPGRARGELQLIAKDGQSIGGFRFNFTVKKALVDEMVGPVKEYYVQDLEAIKAEIQKTADSIKDLDVVRIDTKLNELEEQIGEGVGVDEQARQEIQEVTEQLADTVKEVNGVKPNNGKITLPIPEVDTSNLATKTEIQQLSLAFKESYETLATLQSAYPNGDNANHAVLSDKMIYTYKNGWISTGIQANGTGIAPATITPDTTTFIRKGENLYNKKAAILNKVQKFQYRVSTYADLDNSTTYGMSNLIPLKGSGLGTPSNPLNFVSKNVDRMYFYRADGTVVGDKGITKGADYDTAIMNGLGATDAATAMAFRFLNENKDNIILQLGDSFNPNAAYGDVYDDLIIKETNLSPEVKELLNSGGGGGDDVLTDKTVYFPSRVYAKIDDELYMDIENAVTSKKLNDFSINKDGTDGGSFNKRIGVPNYSITSKINVEDAKTGKVLESHSVGFIRVNPSLKQNPPSTQNVLCIGDSFTDAGYIPCDIKRQLTTYGFTNFNFVGTRSDTINGVTALNEGRGGYSWNDFLKTDNSGGRGSTYANPFLIGGSVSLKKYMEANSFGSLDYAILELGVNNLVASTVEGTNTVESITAKAREMINLIHTEYPNCKIFLVGLVYITDINGNLNPVSHNSKVMNLNKAYQDMVSKLPNNASGVNTGSYAYYVDTGCLFKRDIAYPVTEVTYRGSTEKYKKQTDWLHPNEAGYYMMSDRIVACIVNYLQNKS